MLGIGVFTPKTEKDVRRRAAAMSLMTKPIVRQVFSKFGKYLPPMRNREDPIV